MTVKHSLNWIRLVKVNGLRARLKQEIPREEKSLQQPRNSFFQNTHTNNNTSTFTCTLIKNLNVLHTQTLTCSILFWISVICYSLLVMLCGVWLALVLVLSCVTYTHWIHDFWAIESKWAWCEVHTKNR